MNFDFGEYSFKFASYAKQNYKPSCVQKKCYFTYPCNSHNECTPIEIKIAKGKYFFEVFGAQGGYYGATGGMGGYAAETITVLSNMSVFLLIGSMGAYQSTSQTFNGGGSGSNGASGGGATDFRTSLGQLSSRFLIAGGGGGEYRWGSIYSGGFGGGENCGPKDYGASQTGPGSSGTKGEPGKGASGDCGGGGGLYGGNYKPPCGGGSGFVYSKNRITKIIDDIDESLMKIEDGILLPGKNSGDGYATITLISNEINDKNALKNWIMTCPCKISPQNASYYLFYGLVNVS